eukprot:CAMPEP_0117436250 /NCGR_PEP_ID=MMETSP0759-20121206/909_1 /TAXON_ID=63605 /ORGANISM="Percolomonas cosmopolitus, Strain WS" /LENGTH=474 /DNA_ID=CAMNT_0005227841 /DNA_START=529 /DNA_END=1953 /DNA_ORIENTATION=+
MTESKKGGIAKKEQQGDKELSSSCPYLNIWRDTVWIQCAQKSLISSHHEHSLSSSSSANVLFVDLAAQSKSSKHKLTPHFNRTAPFNSLRERIQHLSEMQYYATNPDKHPLLCWLLKKSNIQAIISPNASIIHPEVESVLHQNGIHCISGLTKRIYEKLRSLLGGASVRSMQSVMDMFPEGVGGGSPPKPESLLGHTQRITIERLSSSQQYYVFHKPPRRRVLTLIVSAPHSQELKNIVMSAVDSALNCVNFATKDGVVLPGGGAFEMMLSSFLRKTAPTLKHSKHQSMYLALSRSLESIPMGILAAYSMPVNELMDLWRARADSQVEAMVAKRSFEFPMPNFEQQDIDSTKSPVSDTLARFVNLLDLKPEQQVFDVLRLKLTVLQGGIKLVQNINQIHHVIQMKAPAGGAMTEDEQNQMLPTNEPAQHEENIESGITQERRAIADVYQRHSSRFPKNQQWIQHARSLELKSRR